MLCGDGAVVGLMTRRGVGCWRSCCALQAIDTVLLNMRQLLQCAVHLRSPRPFSTDELLSSLGAPCLMHMVQRYFSTRPAVQFRPHDRAPLPSLAVASPSS